MKKKLGFLLCVSVLVFGMLTACGKDEGSGDGTENIITTDGTEYVNENPDKEADVVISEDSGEPVEETVISEEDGTDVEMGSEDADATEDGSVKEYNMAFYQYGEYLYDRTLKMTDTEFQMINAETGTVEYMYPYVILSDNLIALYAEESQAYAIAYYKISGFDYTLNVLGATAATLVGSYDVYYVDQGATATIEFTAEGTAVESNQVSADGYEMNEPYEFTYCWYAADDVSLFLFVCLDNGYFAYSVEASEDGTLYLTETGAYTYDL